MTDMTKADFIIGIKKPDAGGRKVLLTIRMLIGDQPVWKLERDMDYGETLTVGSVSVPTDELMKYLLANCTFK